MKNPFPCEVNFRQSYIVSVSSVMEFHRFLTKRYVSRTRKLLHFVNTTTVQDKKKSFVCFWENHRLYTFVSRSTDLYWSQKNWLFSKPTNQSLCWRNIWMVSYETVAKSQRSHILLLSIKSKRSFHKSTGVPIYIALTINITPFRIICVYLCLYPWFIP